MFLSARLKLTAWYVLTVMVVSAAFSLVIFSILTSELNRLESEQRVRITDSVLTGEISIPANLQLVAVWKQKIKEALWAVNLALFVVSSFVSYVLAGKALSPIQTAMEEQNRFVSDASHELRTPLATLKSEIEVTLRDRYLSLNGARQVLESNLEEVDNLSRLSNNLLEMSRYKSGGLAVTLETISLDDVLSAAVKRTQTQADKKKIKIVNKSKQSNILADRQGLVRLFTILLDNAIKYSGEGKEVTIDSRASKKTVVVEVSDQGEGVPREDLPHIFDRFYRADKSRSKLRVGGYGLGLSIAKEIIAAHGGEIRVKSKAGKGSKFSVVLQVA